MNARRLFIISTLFFVAFSFAQAQLKLSVQYRPRAELRDGYFTLGGPGTNMNFHISQRSRFTIEYAHELVDMKLTFQDVRTWGDQTQLVSVPKAGIHEAWVKLKLKDKVFIKLGRQEWVYDDHRLLGNVDWIQPARAHDGALIQYIGNGIKVDAGGAYNQPAQNLFGTAYGLANYKVLGFMRIEKTFKDDLNVSVIALTDGNETTTGNLNTLFRVTYGANVLYKTDKLFATGRIYLQNGKTAARATVAGHMLNMEVGYKADKFVASVGYDRISGNDATDAAREKDNRFNTLFATNHKFYGLMDYFLNLPVHSGGGGLQDIFLKFKYKGLKKFTPALHYHYFLFANNVMNPTNLTETLDMGLGSEIDLVMTYKYHDWIKFQGGFSTLIATTSMEAIKGGNRQHFQYWGWLQVVVSPTVFKN